MSASPTPSSSSSVPDEIISKPSKKSKNKGKKSAATKTPSGKNEGIDPHWAYKPPPGVVLVEEDVDVDAGEFDWDAINNDDDLDLCLIRVPESVSGPTCAQIQTDMNMNWCR